jgi:hypothetical protein
VGWETYGGACKFHPGGPHVKVWTGGGDETDQNELAGWPQPQGHNAHKTFGGGGEGSGGCDPTATCTTTGLAAADSARLLSALLGAPSFLFEAFCVDFARAADSRGPLALARVLLEETSSTMRGLLDSWRAITPVPADGLWFFLAGTLGPLLA